MSPPEDTMHPGKLFRRAPLAWANVAFIVILYGIFGAVVLKTQGRITGADIGLIWPIHLMLALNLLAIFGPTKRR